MIFEKHGTLQLYKVTVQKAIGVDHGRRVTILVSGENVGDVAYDVGAHPRYGEWHIVALEMVPQEREFGSPLNLDVFE